MTDRLLQNRLIENLLQMHNAQHPDEPFTRLDTHISTILLGPRHVYKIKKPVNFGFLDFSTLAKRQHYCEEEIRLNRRLAPSVYLDTTAITGSLEQPSLGGTGEVLEYAVRMRRFDEQGELDRLLAKGQLNEPMIHQLADAIASFHQSIPAVPGDTDDGGAQQVLAPMLQNFTQIESIIDNREILHQLKHLQKWTRQQFERLQPVLTGRRQTGFIRECHGDLHLGNIAFSNNELIIFDGIEFNANLRWIDVISELAFITMDLTDHGASSLAYALLNRYLERTGDYQGLALLRFYQVYRALVRAKVAALGLSQADDETHGKKLISTCHDYIDLAEGFSRQANPGLILMAGFSASGKSMVSEHLLQQIGAIRLRSDRERKRLFEATNHESEILNEGLYHPDLSAKTYQHLLQLSQQLIERGFTVIVDATFLQREKRSPFQRLAVQLGCPFRVIWLQASRQTLLDRLKRRQQDTDNISDATPAVLEAQQMQADMPGRDENTTIVDTEKPLDAVELCQRLGLDTLPE